MLNMDNSVSPGCYSYDTPGSPAELRDGCSCTWLRFLASTPCPFGYLARETTSAKTAGVRQRFYLRRPSSIGAGLNVIRARYFTPVFHWHNCHCCLALTRAKPSEGVCTSFATSALLRSIRRFVPGVMKAGHVAIYTTPSSL